MIAILILLLFVFNFIRKFDKTFILFMVLNVYLSQFVTPFDIGLFALISLCAFVIFHAKYKVNVKRYWSLPVFIPLLMMVCSIVISNHFSAEKHYKSLFLEIICIYNVVIFWNVLQTDPNRCIKKFVKYSLVYGGIVSLYALFETVTRQNPYIEIVNSLDLYSNAQLIDEIRFFLKRSQSIFFMHGTNGVVALLTGVTLLYVKRYSQYLNDSKNTLFFAYLLFATVFFTGTRSAILGFVVSYIAFLGMKTMRMKYVFVAMMFICIGMVVFGEYFNVVYNSFANTDSVNGSNSEMRDTQFGLAFYYLNRSFWIGNGIAYTWNYVLVMHKELYGAESLWIPIMIDQGILGVASYVLFMLGCAIYVKKHNCSNLLFFILGVILFNSMSSIPGFKFYYILIYILIMVQARQLDKQNKQRTA